MTQDEWVALLRRWHIADESGDWRTADALLAEIERTPEPEPEEKETTE